MDELLMPLYHVTSTQNLQSILEHGLVPQIGPRSFDAHEKEPAVYLFFSKEDAEDAICNWLGDWYEDHYGDAEDLVILEISGLKSSTITRAEQSFEAICRSTIQPSCIKVLNQSSLQTPDISNERTDYMMGERNKVKVYNQSDEIQYWSNALGELHCHGEYDIEESELPQELHHAYHDLFFEGDRIGSLRYLVETETGYGIALINEYDDCYADDCGISMDDLFKSAQMDAASIAADPLFARADIYVGEYMGFCNCHDLIVVFPADISTEDFLAAATKLDTLVYQAAKELPKQSLTDKIQNAAARAGQVPGSHLEQRREQSPER